METVPTMITSKDLSYIEDMLNWNFNTIKKMNHYLSEVDDEDIIELFKKIIKVYKKHYINLVECLEIGGNNES